MSKGRIYHLKRTYGITLEQYTELLEKQDYACAVCKKKQDKIKYNLHVDHDHKTGEIRGLLCFNCNNKIIGRHTDPKLLAQAVIYLTEFKTGWFVPEKKKKIKRKILKVKQPKETAKEIFKGEKS